MKKKSYLKNRRGFANETSRCIAVFSIRARAALGTIITRRPSHMASDSDQVGNK